jgi:hypothetical protein
MLDADLAAAAARAAVALRPARLEQIGAAGHVVGEAALKLDDRAREGGASHPSTVGQPPDGPNRIVMWGPNVPTAPPATLDRRLTGRRSPVSRHVPWLRSMRGERPHQTKHVRELRR